MNKTFTCILCPNGCEVSVSFRETEVLSVTGNKCPKGADYVKQEIQNPVRNIASSVLVENGVMPLCSVRKIRVTAPVRIGDILLPDVLGLGSDVIATRNVERAV